MSEQVEVVAGQIWKLKVPQWAKTFGQGEPPASMKMQFGERVIELEFGKEFKASGSCDYNNDPPICSLNQTPPLLRTEFIEKNIDQFELIEEAEEE